MLRARKILGYVAERIEPAPTKEDLEKSVAEGGVLRPEEYLELWCNGQVCFPLPLYIPDVLVTVLLVEHTPLSCNFRADPN